MRTSTTSTTFTNPVIPGMHPDPSICRVGRDFYLVTSSFEYFPGVPLFHSRDLVNWEQIGHVLTRPSQVDLRRVRSSGGIYAPTIRFAHGRFYVVTTNVDGGGNFLVTAARPDGPWSDPIWIDRAGIDPSLLFDGRTVYYTRNGPGSDRDHPLIYQTTINPRTGKLAGPPRPVWSGLGGIWPEAPHLYKIGGWYYLLTAEGGTGYDHSIVVARSRLPGGPFEGCPRNPVLTHRGRPSHAIGATGHADLVQLSDGRWWAVMLGVRPVRRPVTGEKQRHDVPRDLRHHLGRETFLVPV
ncbi:MAG: glycoside hydrolase family 43 protein, partial [Deltaproteobacteria bacterium]|nr:glycoside hydrolase family 43 protein [Deltaproteobacteria bacterium]